MKRYGLIGFPLGHSFSKKYFTQKFEKEKIDDACFDLFPLTAIEELPQLLSTHPDLRGLSVTIPYKQSVYRYLDEVSIPEGIHACNSIKVENGKLTGFNTDYIGFEKSFSGLVRPHHTNALILGNGGATEAVAYVLKELGINYNIVSRVIRANSTLTYQQIDQDIISTHKVIINATPLGTYPDIQSCPDIPYEYLTPEHYLFDLVYNPDKTLFLQKGELKGTVTKNGYDMLALQAEASWEIWNQ